jgi:imidazolonepropionase-like amidohydrolase
MRSVLANLFLLLIAAPLLARPIAFTNVNVITMTSDAVLTNQVVVIDEGKIIAIGKDGEVTIPDGARKIDGEHGYLIPGLIDLHVHINQPDDASLYVVNGVTTVLNLAGDLGTLDLRVAIARGDRLGPRLLSAGPQIIGVDTASEARKIVQENAYDHYDAIKIYDRISVEALHALIDEAHRNGLLAVGHVPRNLRWQDMLEAKPDAIAHAEEFLYSPVIDGDDAKIVAGMKSGGIALITTLITYDTIGRESSDLDPFLTQAELRYVSPVVRREWMRPRNRYTASFPPARASNFRRLLTFQKRLINQLAKGGVPILLGTDAGASMPFVTAGFSAHDELRELVSAGLTPYQALRAATIDAAHFLRKDADFGTIEVGKSADLVLLRGNPLDDIENAALRAGVMLRGRWLGLDALHAELARVAAACRAEEPMMQALESNGVDAAITEAKRAALRESSINELAYQLLKMDNDPEGAVKIFRANVEMHPGSWEALDALADGLEGADNEAEAKLSRERARTMREGRKQ